MVKVTAVFEVKKEYLDKIEAILIPLIEGSRKDAGNISYDCYMVEGQPGKFMFQECWENQALLDSHMKQPHFTAFGKATEGMLTKPMDIFVLGKSVH